VGEGRGIGDIPPDPGGPGPTDAADLWANFLDTRVRIEQHDGWLEIHRGPAGREPDAASGTGVVHIVTAWNPRGAVMRSLEENQAAQARLLSDVVDRGLPWARAAGIAEDGRWAEASVAVNGMNREDAIALGRRWDQAAIFELRPSDSALVVVGCDGGEESVEVRGELLERRPCAMAPPGARRMTRCSPADDRSVFPGPDEWERQRRIMLAAAGCDVCEGEQVERDGRGGPGG
jgi:hypothetical protein